MDYPLIETVEATMPHPSKNRASHPSTNRATSYPICEYIVKYFVILSKSQKDYEEFILKGLFPPTSGGGKVEETIDPLPKNINTFPKDEKVLIATAVKQAFKKKKEGTIVLGFQLGENHFSRVQTKSGLTKMEGTNFFNPSRFFFGKIVPIKKKERQDLLLRSETEPALFAVLLADKNGHTLLTVLKNGDRVLDQETGEITDEIHEGKVVPCQKEAPPVTEETGDPQTQIKGSTSTEEPERKDRRTGRFWERIGLKFF
ncbi:MAG: hypothetical protein PHS57_04380 [Alphaproteobacteria bacterium]|nr:hypothetical protein [Alphaproteobacteria bacterium]